MSDQIQLRAVCATCHTTIREGATLPGGDISHGICRTCALYTINQMNITTNWKGGFYGEDESERQEKIEGEGRSF